MSTTRAYFLECAMHIIYFRTEKRREQELETILLKNQAAYSSPYLLNIMHKGIYYSSHQHVFWHMKTKPVHKNVRDDFNAWLEEAKYLDSEKADISAMLLRMFNQVRSIAAFKEILPDPLHKAVDTLRGSAPVTEKDIAAFKTENEKYLHIIKRRLTMNIFED